MKVQAWMQDESGAAAGKAVELIRCPACTQLHFVDRKTGKLFGDRTRT